MQVYIGKCFTIRSVIRPIGRIDEHIGRIECVQVGQFAQLARQLDRWANWRANCNLLRGKRLQINSPNSPNSPDETHRQAS